MKSVREIAEECRLEDQIVASTRNRDGLLFLVVLVGVSGLFWFIGVLDGL